MVEAQILAKGDLPAFVGEDSIRSNARAEEQYAFMSIEGVQIGVCQNRFNIMTTWRFIGNSIFPHHLKHSRKS